MIKNRESNIELLRIILMLMVITHHIIVHGLGLKAIGQSTFLLEKPSVYIELLINSFAVIGVNTFIFISGYFGMKFKIRTIISFILQAVFYSVSIYLIFSYFNHSLWGIRRLIRSFFPISGNLWHFFSLYLGLYFIAPFLNKGIEYIEHNTIIILLIGLLFFDCFSGFLLGSDLADSGYSIFNFITLYVLARYINKYVQNIKKASLYLVISTALIFGSTLILLHYGNLSKIWMIFSYNNPLIIISSIMIFFVFKNIKIQHKLINLLSSVVFGVYLIHDHIFVRGIIIKLVSHIKSDYSGVSFGFVIILLILAIFVVCGIIEMIRKITFDTILNKLEIWGESKTYLFKYKNVL